MRRLLRILLNAATALSLVLCAATVAAWVRSYQARDFVWWSLVNPRREWSLDTYRGGLTARIIFPHEMDDFLARPGVGWEPSAPVSYIKPRRPATASGWLGFAFSLDDQDIDVLSHRRWVACRFWLIMLLTAILPAARLAGWRGRRARRLRMRSCLCRHCGYDCRATPERCPECGIALVTAATPAREGKGETEGV